MKAVLLTILFNLTTLMSFSQIDSLKHSQIKNDSSIYYSYQIERHFSFVTGINLHKNVFGELGVAIKDNGVAGHHPTTRILAFTTEFNFIDEFVIGPKIGFWLGGGSGASNMGLNLIYYSNFHEGTFRLRPEIGMGFGGFRIVYGYNFVLINKDANFINKHNFCINILLNIKKINEIKKYPRLSEHE